MQDNVNIDGKYRYRDLTWPEMNKAIEDERVVILPVATLEQHGHHLPVDTDFLGERIALKAAEQRSDLFLVMPIIPCGFNLHHIDWPGTIHIEGDHFINYLLDITKSLAYHGFKKIIIINGHGSNEPFVDIVARQTNLQTNAQCAAVSWWSLALDAIQQTRETEFPASGHADEIETSAYLYFDEKGVQMEKALKEIPDFYNSDFFWLDLQHSSIVKFQEWWSRWNESGIIGDPTKATKEKGRIIVEAAVNKLIIFGEEFKKWPIRPRRDFHKKDTGKVSGYFSGYQEKE